MDEEPVARTTRPDGVCVECGARIPSEVLETLGDAFRCPACERPQGESMRPDAPGALRRTA